MRMRRLLLLALGLVALLPTALAQPAQARVAGECGAGEHYFAETQKCVPALFHDYWVANGGLAQQGYPVSDAFREISAADGRTYLVQYFERARFEHHPEHAGTPYEVLLGLLGQEQFTPKYPAALPPLSGDPFAGDTGGRECERFAQTGETVCGPFLAYWRANGGLAQQGLPISPIFLETNPTNGRQYPTQYFERARFEFHREFANTPNAVLLGLLGREQLLGKYPGLIPVRQESLTDGTGPTEDVAGWRVEPTPQGFRILIKEQNEGYTLRLRLLSDSPAAAINTLGLNDVRVEADFVRNAGPDDGTMAIGCRGEVENTDRYYLFELGPADGYYRISATTGPGEADFFTLAEGESDQLKVGGARTRLRADCIGDTLTFFVNGQQIASARDSRITGGNAAILNAYAYEAAGMDVTASNVTVAIPVR